MSRTGYDYTTVGHVTADVMADGSRRAGGSAFYSALQAARLGRRALIITQGVPGEIEELLAPYRGEFALEILPGAQTTTLQTSGGGVARTQRVLAWAGPMAADLRLDTSILHLAPVARESPSRWGGRADFVGLTPQGLVRAWSSSEPQISQVELAPELLPARWDAIVISETERDSCARLLSSEGHDAGLRGARAGAGSRDPNAYAGPRVLAVTAEAAATALHLPGGVIARVSVPAIADYVEDIGAGDVFAATFFVALREGQDPQAAAALANAAAAVRISGAGAMAIGDRSAIGARLRAAGQG